MSSAINTALLAYGMSGKVFHAPFLAHHPGFILSSVLERNTPKAVLDYPEVKSYTNLDELLAQPAIELVVVNTPNYTHYEYTKQCLLAGKHVLVEKPFTPSTVQAKELFALAKSKALKLMVYQNRRFDSGFRLTQSIIESGVLGKLCEVHFRFDRYRNHIGPKSFKEDARYPANGLLYDLGPHLLDQAIVLFGKPLSYYKVLAKHREQSQVDDYFFIHLSYPNQLNVFLRSTLLAAHVPPAFELNGTRGSFFKNHGDVQEAQLLAGLQPDAPDYGIERAEDIATLCLVDASEARQNTHPQAPKGNYGAFFDAIYRSLRHNEVFPVTEEQILAQLEILEA